MAIPGRLLSGVIESTVPRLGAFGGSELVPGDVHLELDASPVRENVGTIWDIRRFAVPTAPVVLGTVSDTDAFSRGPDFHVSDMPLKFPGTAYRVPNELADFCETLQHCIDVEHAINRDAADYYAYLTVQRSPVLAGTAVRGSGAHSDSVQGRRVTPKTPVEHAYLVADCDPPLFFIHGFDLAGLDPDVDYLGDAFNTMLDDARTFQPKPYELVLFDVYCVHSAVHAAADRRRTFVRLTMSVREFDRAGNTHNDMFEYDWDMKPRPLPEDLRRLPRD